MSDPILKNITSPPNAGRNELYHWCDYIELRCLSHTDHRFSRDALAEAIDENADNGSDATADGGLEDEETDDTEIEEDVPATDLNEQHAANCFKHLRWREKAFSTDWPFELDAHAQEIKLKPALNEMHRFYLSLLISSSLRYCPKTRWRELTGLFERASLEILKKLMPDGADVHAFGAAESTRYTGHLFDRLTELTKDVRGHLDLEKRHFAEHDTGDGGLDLVAWHGLCDERKGIPIAFAQCGCTVDGWPDKMLQASPARLAGHLNTLHEWSTYYFMPLDLSVEYDGLMDWYKLSDFSRAIVIDRLRFMRMAKLYSLSTPQMTATLEVNEAASLKIA
jgi:hypothetical protein